MGRLHRVTEYTRMVRRGHGIKLGGIAHSGVNKHAIHVYPLGIGDQRSLGVARFRATTEEETTTGAKR